MRAMCYARRETTCKISYLFSKNLIGRRALRRWHHALQPWQETTIHQLRTGKSPLAAHCLTRYGRLNNKGVCPAGCNTMETVEHRISCPMYAKPRNNVIKDLNGEPRKIPKFLRRSKNILPLPLNVYVGICRYDGATDGDRPHGRSRAL